MASVESLEIQVNVNQAISSLQKFQQRMNTLPKSVSKLDRSITKMKQGMRGLGKLMTSPIRAITSLRGALLGLAGAFAMKEFVSFGSNYGREMSKLRALTQSTGKEFLGAKAAIRATGRETAFTATEAAKAANVMASMGKSAKAITGELKTVVQVAGATNTQIDVMAESLASAQNQFKVTAKVASDVFAGAYQKSRANVMRLSDAFKQFGPVAKNAGLSMQEAAGAAMFLMDAGREAGQSGTDLKGVLLKLNTPTRQAGNSFELLGIQFHKFVELPLNERLKALAEGLKTVSKTKGDSILKKIFGQETITGATLLINAYKEGNEVLQTQSEKLKQASSASQMYKEMTNDLKGDLAKLGSVIQDKVLSVFEVFEQAFRDLTQATSTWIEKFDPVVLAKNVLMVAKIIVVFAKESVIAIAQVTNAIGSLVGWIEWTAGFGQKMGAIFSTMGNLMTNGLKEQFLKFKLWIGELIADVHGMIDGVLALVEKATGQDFGTKGRKARRKGEILQMKEDAAFATIDFDAQLATDRASYKKGSALMEKPNMEALVPEGLISVFEKSEAYIAKMMGGIAKIKEDAKEGADALKEQQDALKGAEEATSATTQQKQIAFQLSNETLRAIDIEASKDRLKLDTVILINQIQRKTNIDEIEKQRQIANAQALSSAEINVQTELRKNGLQSMEEFKQQEANLSDEARNEIEQVYAVEKNRLETAKLINGEQAKITEELKKQRTEEDIRNQLSGGNKFAKGAMEFGVGGMVQGGQQLGQAINSQGLMAGVTQGAMAGGPMGALTGAILQLITELEIFKEFMNLLGYIIKIIDAILKPITKMLKSFFKVLDGLVGAIDILMSVFDPLTEAFDGLMEMFGDLLRTFAVILKPLFKALMFFIEPLVAIIEFFMSLLGQGMDAMGGAVLSDEARIEQLESAIEALEGLTDVLEDANQAIKNIEETVRSLMYGDLSILSGQEKLLAAEKDYAKFLSQATQTGTAEDIQQFTGFIQTYLGIAKGVEKSSKAYQTRYEQVMNDLDALEGRAREKASSAFNETNQRLGELNVGTIAWGESIEATTENVTASISNLNAEIEYLNQDGQQNQTQSGGGFDLGEAIMNMAGAIIEAIVKGISAIAETAWKIIVAIVDGIASIAQDAWKIVEGIINFIIEGIKGIGNLGGMFIEGIFKPLAGLALNAGLFLLGLLQPIFKLGVNASEFIMGLLAPITAIMSKFNVGDFIEGIFKPIAELIGKFKIADLLTGIFKPFEGLTGGLGDLLDGIFKPFKGITDGAGKLFTSLLNALGLNKVTDFLGTLVQRLMNALGLGTMDKEIVILPGSLLGQKDPLLAIHFKWGGDGGMITESDMGANYGGANVTSFQTGGMAVGPSHQSGMFGMTKKGTPFLFEGGEYIINKKTAMKLGKNRLDQLNSLGGGGGVGVEQERWDVGGPLHDRRKRSDHRGHSNNVTSFPSADWPMHMDFTDANVGIDWTIGIPDWAHKLFGGSNKVGVAGGMRSNMGPVVRDLMSGDYGKGAAGIMKMLQAYAQVYLGPLGEHGIKIPNFGGGGLVHMHGNGGLYKKEAKVGPVAGWMLKAGAGLKIPDVWNTPAPWLKIEQDNEPYEPGQNMLSDFLAFISSFIENIDGIAWMVVNVLNPANWQNIGEGVGIHFMQAIYQLTGWDPFAMFDDDGFYEGGWELNFGKGGLIPSFSISEMAQGFWDGTFGHRSSIGQALERNKDFWKHTGIDLSETGDFRDSFLAQGWAQEWESNPWNEVGPLGMFSQSALLPQLWKALGGFDSGISMEALMTRIQEQQDKGQDVETDKPTDSLSRRGMGGGGLMAAKLAHDWYTKNSYKGKAISTKHRQRLKDSGLPTDIINRARYSMGHANPSGDFMKMIGNHPDAVAVDDFIAFTGSPSEGRQFKEGTPEWYSLMAHELAHVGQFASRGSTSKKRIYRFIPEYVSNPQKYEAEALRIGTQSMRNIAQFKNFKARGGFIPSGFYEGGGGIATSATPSTPPPSYIQTGSGIFDNELNSEASITSMLLENMNSSLNTATAGTTNYSASMMQNSFVMEQMLGIMTQLNTTLTQLNEETLPSIFNGMTALVNGLVGENGFLPRLNESMFGEEGFIPTLLKVIGNEEGGLTWVISNQLVPAIKEGMENMKKAFEQESGGFFGKTGRGMGGTLGNIVSGIGSVFSGFSDRRLKTGIHSYGGGGGVQEMMSKLTPYQFSYRGGGGVREGIMAQDMERSAYGRQFVMNTPMGKMISGDVLGPVLAYASGGMVDRIPSFQSGGSTQSIAIDNSEVKNLLRQIIMEVRGQSNTTEVNVYADLDGQVENKLTDFRTEIRERSNRGQPIA